MFKDQFYRLRKCPKHIDDNIYTYSPCKGTGSNLYHLILLLS